MSVYITPGGAVFLQLSVSCCKECRYCRGISMQQQFNDKIATVACTFIGMNCTDMNCNRTKIRTYIIYLIFYIAHNS